MNIIPSNASQVIQTILAPAVMISSSGLFFLGLNVRHSSVFTRIRLLKEEKRKICQVVPYPSSDSGDHIRCLNIDNQLNLLLRRAWYLRNAIICHTMAVIFFVITSFSIAINFVIIDNFFHYVTIYFFIIGLCLVLSGIICLVIDEYLAYTVILIEVSEVISKKD